MKKAQAANNTSFTPGRRHELELLLYKRGVAKQSLLDPWIKIRVRKVAAVNVLRDTRTEANSK